MLVTDHQLHHECSDHILPVSIVAFMLSFMLRCGNMWPLEIAPAD